MIPTSIDGTDITGATIDGTDVTEITVDGDVVFSAQTLPVAYSDLVAWYPFDSAEYGGSNADDVTAIIGGSGDDTAYDGTVSGATYQSSGGVTDINSGANSGAFDFDGNDSINIGTGPFDFTRSTDQTIMGWMKLDVSQSRGVLFGNNGGFDLSILGSEEVRFHPKNSNYADSSSGVVNVGQYFHFALRLENSDFDVLISGSEISMSTGNGSPFTTDIVTGDITIGNSVYGGPDLQIDDFRIYDKLLTNSEINQIINNTEP